MRSLAENAVVHPDLRDAVELNRSRTIAPPQVALHTNLQSVLDEYHELAVGGVATAVHSWYGIASTPRNVQVTAALKSHQG